MIAVRQSAYPLFLFLLLLLGGCESHRPPVGEIVVDTDLPTISDQKLPVGITLDVGSQGKDLLTANLIPNADFELAAPLKDCTYDASAARLTTPNGFTTFYPTPEMLYGWGGASGEVLLSQGQTFYHDTSHYLTLRPKDTDSIPCRIFSVGAPLKVRKGERYTFSTFLSSDLAELRVALVRDTLTATPISNTITLQGDVYWNHHELSLTTTTDADSAYLMLDASPSAHPGEASPYPRPRGYVSLDDIRLCSAGETDEGEEPLPHRLTSLLKRLSPDFVRFPGGRTANGYYPGSYPTPHFGRRDTVALWTLGGGEYTGDFGLSQLLKTSDLLGARPILIANAGITDPTARPRYEEAKLIDQRTEYLTRLTMNPSLLVQAGYDQSTEEYRTRFGNFAQALGPDQLLSAGPLIDSLTHFSDYVYDLALTDIKDPHLLPLLPPTNQSLRKRRQRLMIGEATFAAPEALTTFLPPLVQRAAFLIEAERYTPLLEGVGIAPLMSSDPLDFPMILVRGTHYHPTILYDLVKHFREMQGSRVHEVEEEKDICLSLSSDSDGQHYYLKAVNLTRHPLTYRITITGREQQVRSLQAVRFRPTASTTTADLTDFYHYAMEEEQIKLPMRKIFTLTLDPYEILFLDMSDSPRSKGE